MTEGVRRLGGARRPSGAATDATELIAALPTEQGAAAGPPPVGPDVPARPRPAASEAADALPVQRAARRVRCCCCSAAVIEQRRHYANLNRIPHRIMINGIRGKSSITRLCAGALRGGGLVTVAKTTGTAARFIHPDASEEPVYRKFGIANVIEQIGIVRRAAAYRPDALVIECMAVMPELQEISQDKLIRSNIGVLCNVREDHLAEMGPTLDDVARSLSRTMPVGGVCVTAERERLPLLSREAARRDCTLLVARPGLGHRRGDGRVQLDHVQGERRDRARGRRTARRQPAARRWRACGPRRPTPACSRSSGTQWTASCSASPTCSPRTTRSRR